MAGSALHHVQLLQFTTAIVYACAAVATNFVTKAATKLLPGAPDVVLAVQLACMLAAVRGLRGLGLAHWDTATTAKLRAMLPQSLCYGAHAALVLRALATLNVPVYNVLKRMTPVIVLVSKAVMERRLPGVHVTGSVLLTVAGCVVAGLGDLTFDPRSYAVALAAAVLQATYIMMTESMTAPARTSAAGRGAAAHHHHTHSHSRSSLSSTGFVKLSMVDMHDHLVPGGAAGDDDDEEDDPPRQLLGSSSALEPFPASCDTCGARCGLPFTTPLAPSSSSATSLATTPLFAHQHHQPAPVITSSFNSTSSAAGLKGAAAGTAAAGASWTSAGGLLHQALSVAGESLECSALTCLPLVAALAVALGEVRAARAALAAELFGSPDAAPEQQQPHLALEGGGGGGSAGTAAAVAAAVLRSLLQAGEGSQALGGGGGGREGPAAGGWASVVVWLVVIAHMEWVLTGALVVCTQTNSALTTTVVGVLKGILAVALGFVLSLGGVAEHSISALGVVGICMNCAGGVWYVLAKCRDARSTAAAAASGGGGSAGAAGGGAQRDGYGHHRQPRAPP